MNDQRARILHIHTLPVVSGSGINTFLSMNRIDQARYQCALACKEGGRLEEWVMEAGHEFYSIPHFVQPVSPLNDLRALWELKSLLRRECFDIIHTHNSKAGYLGRLAAHQTQRKGINVPAVIHTIHGFAFHPAERFLRRFIFKRLEWQAAPWADRLVVISRPLREWGLKEGIGRPEQYRVIYSGIEMERFKRSEEMRWQVRQKYGYTKQDVVLGVVAKLWKGKGHADLFRALSILLSSGRNENLKLLVVGEGPLEQELVRLTRELGIKEHVRFTGFIEDTAWITQALDLSVLPSYFEGMGRVLLEAQAAGVPVIGTRVGGIVDIVAEGETGFLVEPGVPEELAEKIALLASDEEVRRRMGEEAARRTGELYSAERMIHDLDELYQEVIHEKEAGEKTG